jgi:hypothetical protein
MSLFRVCAPSKLRYLVSQVKALAVACLSTFGRLARHIYVRLSGDVSHSVYWNDKWSKIVKPVNQMSWTAGGNIANKVSVSHKP